MTTKHLYLEFSEPVDPQAVTDLLEQAGLKPSDCRSVTRNHEGHILTDLLAAGVWNQESDWDRCNGPCPENRKHLEWQQLNEEQQDAFLRNYSRFLASCSDEELLLCVLLEDTAEFDGVALDRH